MGRGGMGDGEIGRKKHPSLDSHSHAPTLSHSHAPTPSNEHQHRPHLNLHPLHPDLDRIVFLHSGFDETAH